MTRIRPTIAATALVAVALLALPGCGKALEPYNDAPVAAQNKTPAEVVNMPDGFSNVATKCDHGNRLYVAFKGDGNRAAVAVVANDPSCAGGGR
jgi:hypothetical protein